jgi:hypothetical protein
LKCIQSVYRNGLLILSRKIYGQLLDKVVTLFELELKH